MFYLPEGPISRATATDSYKCTHWKQYPPGSRTIHAYWESRGGRFPEITAFGLQYFLKAFMLKPFTHDEIEQADEFWGMHLGPGMFNRKGWMRIVNVHHGALPLEISAVPEGMTVPVRNVNLVMHNTDGDLPWLTNWWETLLSQGWSPTTVCTYSREIKKVVGSYLMKTGDISLLPFKVHDFGFRGSNSYESAGLAGLAHLVNFLGTDNTAAIQFGRQYYHEGCAGFSIPAAEHSTITSWGGPEKEIDAFRNMIQQYGGHGGDGSGAYAVVSDSWDFFEACKMWGCELIEEVRNAPNMLVVRPDSGVPHVVAVQGIETLDKSDRGGFGHTTNFKGYNVLDGVREIQGDKIDLEEVRRIFEALEVRKWSADNIAFGSGGALLQKHDRDEQQCAFKACYIEGEDENGPWEREVFKQPITQHEKKSKGGLLRLVKNDDGAFETVSGDQWNDRPNELQVKYRDGELLVDHTLAEIRNRAEITEFANV